MASFLKFITETNQFKIIRVYGNFGWDQVNKFLPWALPAAVGAGWMIFPAIPEATKVRLGLISEQKPLWAIIPIKYESEEIDKMPVAVEE